MKNTTEASKSLVKQGTESLGVAMAALDVHIRKAAEAIETGTRSKKKTERDAAHARAGQLVTLGVKMAQIVAEVRKVEHAEARAAGVVTPRALAEYFRRVGPTERAQLIRDLQSIDRKGGVFG